MECACTNWGHKLLVFVVIHRLPGAGKVGLNHGALD